MAKTVLDLVSRLVPKQRRIGRTRSSLLTDNAGTQRKRVIHVAKQNGIPACSKRSALVLLATDGGCVWKGRRREGTNQ
eukprot:4772842-Amphidinium_carterae.1